MLLALWFLLLSVSAVFVVNATDIDEEMSAFLQQMFLSPTEKLQIAFKNGEYAEATDLLLQGADPTVPFEDATETVLELIFEDLIIYEDREISLPLLEALFKYPGNGRYLLEKSSKTKLPLGAYVGLSPLRIEILELIHARLELTLDQLMTLNVAFEPFQMSFNRLNAPSISKKSGESDCPFLSASAWEMFYSAQLVQKIPLEEAIKCHELFSAMRDTYFTRKFAVPESNKTLE